MARQERTSFANKGEIEEMMIHNTEEKYETYYVPTKDENGNTVPQKKERINPYYEKVLDDNEYYNGLKCFMLELNNGVRAVIDSDSDCGELWNKLRNEIKEEVCKKLLDYMDIEVNHYAVALIDGMDEEEYKAKMQDIYGEEYDNYLHEQAREVDKFRELTLKESRIEE